MLGIFLDIEANGLNFFYNRSVEVALRIIDLTDGRELDSYDQIVSQPRDVWEKSDLSSLKVNGFTWELVSSGKPEKEVADEILTLFHKHKIRRKQAIFICQNPSFDRAFFSQIIDPDKQEMLKWPYHWLDLASMYYAFTMEKAINEKEPLPWEVGLSKDNMAGVLELPVEESPHRAINGVDHLILLYSHVVGFPLQVTAN